MARQIYQTVSIPMMRDHDPVDQCPEVDDCRLEVVDNRDTAKLEVVATGEHTRTVRVGMLAPGGGCDYTVRVGMVSDEAYEYLILRISEPVYMDVYTGDPADNYTANIITIVKTNTMQTLDLDTFIPLDAGSPPPPASLPCLADSAFDDWLEYNFTEITSSQRGCSLSSGTSVDTVADATATTFPNGSWSQQADSTLCETMWWDGQQYVYQYNDSCYKHSATGDTYWNGGWWANLADAYNAYALLDRKEYYNDRNQEVWGADPNDAFNDRLTVLDKTYRTSTSRGTANHGWHITDGATGEQTSLVVHAEYSWMSSTDRVGGVTANTVETLETRARYYVAPLDGADQLVFDTGTYTAVSTEDPDGVYTGTGKMLFGGEAASRDALNVKPYIWDFEYLIGELGFYTIAGLSVTGVIATGADVLGTDIYGNPVGYFQTLPMSPVSTQRELVNAVHAHCTVTPFSGYFAPEDDTTNQSILALMRASQPARNAALNNSIKALAQAFYDHYESAIPDGAIARRYIDINRIYAFVFKDKTP